MKKSGKRIIDQEEENIEMRSDAKKVKKAKTGNVWELFDQGFTVPFLARYRKELTGNMSAEQLRTSFEEFELKKEVDVKASKLIVKLEKCGQLNPHLRQSIEMASTLEDVETLAAPFKASSTTQSLANKAKSIPGLQEAATGLLILQQEQKNPLAASEILQDAERRLQVGYIISDDLLHRPEITQLIAHTFCSDRRIHITSKGVKTKAGQAKNKSRFESYFDFRCSINSIKPHQVLALNRGEKKKELKLAVEIPDAVFERDLECTCLRLVRRPPGDSQIKNLISEAMKEAYKRLVKPMIKRKVRALLTRNAEKEALNVFANNLRELLLTPPCRNSVIMAIDPGFKHGCKVAVINHQGNLLKSGLVYLPKFGSKLSQKDQDFMLNTIEECQVNVIGIGNGCGFGPTEKMVADLIKTIPRKVTFTSVNEDGASIYSVTPEASEEFPSLDPNIISAVSIARRLQDPLAEYVKIGPSHLGVGMYQHDLSETKLSKTLDAIVTECVSFVGVDLNHAPVYLLRHVSGITGKTAEHIVQWRMEKGEFKSRSELQKVRGMGPKSFEQCAGFVRIIQNTQQKPAIEPLDATLIHPESYDTAKRLLTSHGFSSREIGSRKLMTYFQELQEPKLTSTKQLIIEALQMDPYKDFRDSLKSCLFKTKVLSLESLKVGQVLEGSVKNVTHFGAFVDISVGKDALLHQSQFKSKISVGQRLQVGIKSLELDKERISLSLVKIY